MCKTVLISLSVIFSCVQVVFAQLSISNAKPQEIRDSVFFMIHRGTPEKACALLNESLKEGIKSERQELLFSVHEKVLSDFILGNYNVIIEDAQKGYNEVLGYPFENIDDFNEYYIEATDTLEELLMSFCQKEYVSIAEKISNDNNLSLDHKKFLLIKLEYSSHYGKFCTFDGESLIANANEFVDESSDLLLVSHTKDLVWDNDYSRIGAGSSLYIGAPLFSQQLGKSFSTPLMYGLALDFSYKNVRLFSHWGVTTKLTATSEMEKTEGWKEGDRALMPHLNVGLGYNVFNLPIVNIFPYVGIHASGFKNISDESSLFADNPGNFSSKYNPLGGLIVDYNIVKRNCDEYLLRNKERKMMFVRLQGMYSPQIYDNKVSGDLFFFALGVGIYTDHNGY